MLLTDGRLRVLVGRLSMSDAVKNRMEPVRLLFTDSSGFITCYVSAVGISSFIFAVTTNMTRFSVLMLMVRRL